MIETLVEVKLHSDEDFLKVKETLTRIGVASKNEKKLYQSCHILHKKKKFYIVHFKELFALDGKPTDFSEEDKGRRNVICSLLEQWGLVGIVNPDQIKEPTVPINSVRIIAFRDKPDWELCTKYSIGRKRA